jgi:hypothetical protein
LSRLLCALLLVIGAPAGAYGGEIGFVYVESNVGGASGGHFALRIGERVYSYAASEGLLLLERRHWDEFVFLYASLENRPIHVAYVELEPKQLRLVRDGFAGRYLAQRRARADLADQRANAALLEALLGERVGVATPGAGLLDPESRDTEDGSALREQIELGQGRKLLPARIVRLERRLRAPPGASGESLLDRREWLSERAALIALLHGQGLATSAVVRPAGPKLSPDESALLASLRARLAEAVVELLRSPRPDRGRALFLATARHHAASRSLRESRWVLLDPLQDGDPVLGSDAVRRDREELAALSLHAEHLWRAERARLQTDAALDARGYQRLEERAAQVVEYRRALVEQRAVRRVVERQPPGRARALVPLATTAQNAELRALLAATRKTTAQREDVLRRAHGYDLFRHNCATGIISTLNTALGGPLHAPAALGAELRPGAGLGFVPFALYADLRERLPVSRSERIPSYRERRLAELAGGGALVRAREVTTLTSQIYRQRRTDGSFVLFASDAGWARPLYGIVNLGYASAHTLAGVASAPLDRGQRFERGVRGMLFSLPELVGLAVRKGSFDARAFDPPQSPD